MLKEKESVSFGFHKEVMSASIKFWVKIEVNKNCTGYESWILIYDMEFFSL